MSDIDRRQLLRGAVALAALAGVATLTPEEAAAMPRARLPRPKKDRNRVPIRIESETKIDVAGELDLSTVELEREGRTSTHVRFHITVDSFETRKSVKDVTDEVERLAHVDGELHRPPVCVVTWGKSLSFKGIVESAPAVGYTMFLPDGTPVRATCTLRFAIQPRGGTPSGR